MNTFEKLEALTALAEQNESLRRRLLETRAQRDPLAEFCRLAQKAGVALTPGELFAVGQEYSCLLYTSTAGGKIMRQEQTSGYLHTQYFRL